MLNNCVKVERVALIMSNNEANISNSWKAVLAASVDVYGPDNTDNSSLVHAYRQAYEKITNPNVYDIIIFTCLPALQPEENKLPLQQLTSLFLKNPRTACMALTGIKNQQPQGTSAVSFMFSSCTSLDCFMIKPNIMLPMNFPCDLGVAEEFAYQQLKRGLLLSSSTMPFAKAANSTPKPSKQSDAEFAARYFVEQHGRDWDLVISSYLPFDLQRENHFTHCRIEWESVLSPHEKSLYKRTLFSECPTEPLQLGHEKVATQHFGIIRVQTIVDACDTLHPWYYHLHVGTHEVMPGIQAKETLEIIESRKAFMEKMLLKEVFKRYDFSNKHILDVGSNCAYFSAQYARAGATRVTALEGRLQHIHQGQLFWGINNFIPGGHYEFLHCNVDDPDTKETLMRRGPFDFTLCAGLLYHLPHPILTLEMLASITKEAMVIDTRVSPDAKQITEPGGCSFDAIVQTRHKVNPQLDQIIQTLNDCGFSTENITSKDPVATTVPIVDNYEKGNRVTLFARRGRI